MEKYAWKARVVPGKIEEYRKRHEELWQEMKDMFCEAGISNYTIWNVQDELFGYYECELGVEHALKVQNESAAVRRWNEHMKDILIMEMDEKTGGQPSLEKVFEY